MQAQATASVGMPTNGSATFHDGREGEQRGPEHDQHGQELPRTTAFARFAVAQRSPGPVGRQADRPGSCGGDPPAVRAPRPRIDEQPPRGCCDPEQIPHHLSDRGFHGAVPERSVSGSSSSRFDVDGSCGSAAPASSASWRRPARAALPGQRTQAAPSRARCAACSPSRGRAARAGARQRPRPRSDRPPAREPARQRCGPGSRAGQSCGCARSTARSTGSAAARQRRAGAPGAGWGRGRGVEACTCWATGAGI